MMAQLDDVNSTDLLDGIRLGCRAMGSVFNADDPQGVAFFDAVALPEPRLSFSDVHSEAHLPGRHLNGLLAAEGLAAVPIDDAAVQRHRAALLFSYSGNVPLPLNRARIDGPLEHFCQHNVREGLHGLAGLVRWRADDEALTIATRSIDFIANHWRPPDDWSVVISPPDCQSLTLVQGLGRAIGPLVKLWLATGHEPAIDLARRVADVVVDAFPPDGAFRADLLGTHTHSITSTLSSLAQLADAQADRALIARVAAFYGNGLWQVRDELGWAIESTAPDANPDKGEGNSSGDIVETALILGRHGSAAAHDDVERIVRAQLLPSQLRDISWIPGSAGTDDGTRNVADRLRGAFGFPAPYGHDPIGLDRIKFNLDIVGGVVASLAEVAAARPWIQQRGDTAITELELRHRTRTIRVRLAGQSVLAMEDVGAGLRFFPALA